VRRDQIVARQVHKHDVLGVFFRIGQQTLLVGHVGLHIGAARQRAGDGPKFSLALMQLDQCLGRRAHHFDAAQLHVIHVRRRVDESQRAIDLKRVELVRAGETAGQHQLIDITGSDVVLGAFNAGHIGLARQRHLGLAEATRGTWRRQGSAQGRDDLRAQRLTFVFAAGMQQRDGTR
jgi:hypothetical protein